MTAWRQAPALPLNPRHPERMRRSALLLPWTTASPDTDRCRVRQRAWAVEKRSFAFAQDDGRDPRKDKGARTIPPPVIQFFFVARAGAGTSVAGAASPAAGAC